MVHAAAQYRAQAGDARPWSAGERLVGRIGDGDVTELGHASTGHIGATHGVERIERYAAPSVLGFAGYRSALTEEMA